MHPPTHLRWLYVDFNSYFASVEQQLNPALRGKPVIVLPVMTEHTSAIAASIEAKRLGIRTGTTVREARRLCPSVICVAGRHDHYVEYHHRLIAEIGNHIPVTDVCSIDEMACALLRNEQNETRVADIARNIKAGISRNIGAQILCSIGVAPSKYLAKVATDMQKPDGFTVLKPQDIPYRLRALHLRDLPGIGPNMEERLFYKGIYDIETLLKYDAKHLRAIWGSLWGERMWYLLRGYDLPEAEAKRSSIGHSHVLPPELRPPEEARHVARRLSLKAAARLRRMQYAASRLILSARVENGPRLAFESRFPAAHDSFTLLGILEALWAEVARGARHFDRNARFKKISVTLLSLEPAAEAGAQGDLFAVTAPARAKCEKISGVMDALNAKYGRDTVLLGLTPRQGRSFSGTRVAFTRIPDREEFRE